MNVIDKIVGEKTIDTFDCLRVYFKNLTIEQIEG
jgi:hypothetical protein